MVLVFIGMENLPCEFRRLTFRLAMVTMITFFIEQVSRIGPCACRTASRAGVSRRGDGPCEVSPPPDANHTHCVAWLLCRVCPQGAGLSSHVKRADLAELDELIDSILRRAAVSSFGRINSLLAKRKQLPLGLLGSNIRAVGTRGEKLERVCLLDDLLVRRTHEAGDARTVGDACTLAHGGRRSTVSQGRRCS